MTGKIHIVKCSDFRNRNVIIRTFGSSLLLGTWLTTHFYIFFLDLLYSLVDGITLLSFGPILSALLNNSRFSIVDCGMGSIVL